MWAASRDKGIRKISPAFMIEVVLSKRAGYQVSVDILLDTAV